MIRRDVRSLVKFFTVAFIIMAIIGYSFFQSRNLIRGPSLDLMTPKNGSTVTDPLVEIKGVAKNISFISLNNRQIFVDENGNFHEELLLSPGYNLWKIEAKDKFGRIVSKRLELVLSKNL